MIHAKPNELSSDIATMAVTDKRILSTMTIEFCLSQGLKTSFNPFFSNVITSSTFGIASPTPILVHCRRNPCCLNCGLSCHGSKLFCSRLGLLSIPHLFYILNNQFDHFTILILILIPSHAPPSG